MAEHPPNHPTTTYVILFIFFISSTVISTKPTCNKMDQDTLWSSFDLPSSHLNWSSNDCCHWEGVTCDMEARVTHIRLPSKGLKLKGGNIFHLSSIGNLTHLTHLNLSHNSLEGSLDQTGFFSPLSRLEIIDLSYNLLSGELPFSLPSRNIRILDLSNNHFHGAIPFSFFQQAWNLTIFNISNNTFSGAIPSSICLHSSPLIQVLDFSVNNFNGSISREVGKCSKLQVFRAGRNNFSGTLSNDFYNATKLEEISLPHNSLYGAISERILNLTNLRILEFTSNGMSGVLPRSIGKLTKLKFLLLRLNNLEGYLPSSLMNCTDLIELHLGYNRFEGNISVLNFSKLNQLSKLDLRANYLTGVLPISLYSCKSLKAIQLSNNKLEGEIQPEIVSLKSLSFLALGYNRFMTNITGAMKILMHCKSLVLLAFTGSFVGEQMPTNIGMVDFDGFQNLKLLALANCELTGQIPPYLAKLKKLELLFLENNRITGSIPSWLGTLPRLYAIDLSSNLITGEFPKGLCRLPMLVSDWTAVQVNSNDFGLPLYGPVGASVLEYKWSNFPLEISLRNNTISGSIPVEIGQLQLLHLLDLSDNNFSGNIPHQISNITSLEHLDLSMNHLCGKIPSSFTSLTFLNFFNVSYNNLEGSIPTSTQLQSFNASAFEGNVNLCGAPLTNECLPVKGNDADNVENDENEDQIPWLHIFISLGFIVGFWAVCGTLALKKNWRNAYFQFLDSAQEKCMANLQRRLGS